MYWTPLITKAKSLEKNKIMASLWSLSRDRNGLLSKLLLAPSQSLS